LFVDFESLIEFSDRWLKEFEDLEIMVCFLMLMQLVFIFWKKKKTNSDLVISKVYLVNVKRSLSV